MLNCQLLRRHVHIGVSKDFRIIIKFGVNKNQNRIKKKVKNKNKE